jgi:hypothetical protein
MKAVASILRFCDGHDFLVKFLHELNELDIVPPMYGCAQKFTINMAWLP